MNESLPPASDILAALGQAAFVWDIAADRLVWSEHVAAVFPDIPLERLATATEFSNLIVAQEAYSSNAKVVTTANQMLQATHRPQAPHQPQTQARIEPSRRGRQSERIGCAS